MPDERTNEDKRIAPIALPAGSFELTELDKAIAAAVSVDNRDKHPERVTSAIVKTIKNPELLAGLDVPAIPNGAELVDQDVVYVEGADPVSTKGIAFKAADADTGEDAAKMAYPDRPDAVAVPANEAFDVRPDTADGAATLAEQAAERVEGEVADATTRTSGGKRSSK